METAEIPEHMRSARYSPRSLRTILCTSLFILGVVVLCFLLLDTRDVSAEPYEGEYHSLAEIEEELVELHNDYPEITELYDLADHYDADLTHMGRTVYALKVSDNPGVEEEDEEDVLIVATHHAREWISYEVVLYFTRSLLENYTGAEAEGEGGDVEYTTRSDYIINNRELWIIPVLNPDGLYESHQRNDRENNWTGWRKNLRDNNGNGQADYQDDGVDLNRNYGYMWGHDDTGSSPSPSSTTYRGPSAWSEPENRMMRALVEDEDHDFRTALTYHSKGEMILYPFGYEALDPEEHFTQFITLANEMAYWSGYEAGNYKSGTIYKVNGDMVDYLYGEHEVIVYTIELGKDSDRFIPDESRIVPISRQNFEQNFLLAEQAPQSHTIFRYVNCEDLRDVDENDDDWELSDPEEDQERFGGKRSWMWRSGGEGGGDGSSLTTDPITITENTVLSFWQRYGLGEEAAAFVSVEKNHDGNWRKIIPLGGYDTNDEKHGLIYEESKGWHKEVFDLSPFVGEKDEDGKAIIQLRFSVAGSSASPGSHWCIDNMALYQEDLGIDYEPDLATRLDEGSFTLVKGEEQSVNITLENTGNAMNSLKLRVIHQNELLERGFHFELANAFFSLEPGEQATTTLSFYTTRALYFEEVVEFQLKASSEFPDYQQEIDTMELVGAAVVEPEIRVDGELFYVMPEQWDPLLLTLRNKGTMNSTVFELGVEVLNPSPGDGERWRMDIPEHVVLDAFETEEIELGINASWRLSFPKEKRFRVHMNFSEETTRQQNPGIDLSGLVLESSSDSCDFSVYLKQYADGCISTASFGNASWGDELGKDDSWKQSLTVPGISPGKENSIRLQVLNKGNVGYPFTLAVREAGWEFEILVDGDEKNASIIKFAGAGTFELVVTPPADTALGRRENLVLELYLSDTLAERVPVQLVTGPSYFFEVLAVDPLDSDEAIDLVPGKEEAFLLEIHNTGNTKNLFMLETNLDEAWQPGLTHEGQEISVDDPLELDPQEETTASLHITMPRDMSFNQRRYCELTVINLGEGSSETFFVEFRALTRYDVCVSVDVDDEITMKRGESFSVLVTVENNGNAPYEVNLSVSGLPPHWQWWFEEEQVSVRDTRKVALEVTVPEDDSLLSVDSLMITADAGDDLSGFSESTVSLSLSPESSGGEEDGDDDDELPDWTIPVIVVVLLGGAAASLLLGSNLKRLEESSEYGDSGRYEDTREHYEDTMDDEDREEGEEEFQEDG